VCLLVLGVAAVADQAILGEFLPVGKRPPRIRIRERD
jgi:hypothetical protein